MPQKSTYEKELAFQADRRRATVEFIKIVSDLWYDKSIELVLFRNQLIDRNVSEILNLHEYAGAFVQKPISIFDSVEIAQAIKILNLPPAKLDIGKLTYEFHLEDQKHGNVMAFVSEKLKDARKNGTIQPKDVILYGFGRIGRLVARELMVKAGKGNQLRLRAIVIRGDINPTTLEKRASLLRNDSVHGDFLGTVTIDDKNSALIINGTTVHVISANAPEGIDYTAYGIKNALVIDNTGAYRDEESLGRHLQSKGVEKVLLTAPGKGIPNIVYGVNHIEYKPEQVNIFFSSILYNQCHYANFKGCRRNLWSNQWAFRNHSCLYKRPKFGG
jgi:glyceraldehyde 3-phosphate dehydrogenase